MRQQFFTWLFSSSVKAKRYFEMKGPWKLLNEVSLTTSYVVSDSFIYDICSCRIKFKLELARLALEPSFLKNNHSIQVCKITSHTRYNTVLLSTSTLDQKYKHSIFTLVLVLSFQFLVFSSQFLVLSSQFLVLSSQLVVDRENILS